MASSLIRNPGRLTTISAECYIKYNAIARKDEFYSKFVSKVASSAADTTNRTIQTVGQKPPVSSDLMMSSWAKQFLLGIVQNDSHWGLLDMFVLLSEDIVTFDVNAQKPIYQETETNILSKFPHHEHGDLLLELLRVKCPKLTFLSLRFLDISPQTLHRFTVDMHHMTRLNLSGVLCTDRYDGVLRAISVRMPNLKALDISQSAVQANAIELLLPTNGNFSRGCPELASLNIEDNRFVTVKLLKKFILRLPKLRLLISSLLLQVLTELTEEELDEETGRSLEFFYSGVPCNWWCQPKDYAALLMAPVFPRLSNILEVEINVEEQSELVLISEVLMSMTNIRRLTMSGMSNFHTILLPALEANEGYLIYLYLHGISGGLKVSDITKTCPGLVELTIQCIPESKTHLQEIELSQEDCVITSLRKLELQFVDKQLCNEVTLLSLLLSPSLEELVLCNVEAMSDNVMFRYLSILRQSYLQSSIVNKIFLMHCSNITEEPLVHWLTMEDCTCMLEFIYLECCTMVDIESIKTASKKYNKMLTLIEA